ncbi:MAG: alpha/beta hydrolase [Planctomycetota bacterium]|nr:MAG: alpha/beta hydrolase [Planctomycetota bacterium]
MVTRGQLLERPVIVPAGSLCLDGIYLRGAGPALLVASPLPGRGGCMANPIGCELAYAAARAGAASLRLDYRGVGASEGERAEDLAPLVEDLAAGATFLRETVGEERLVLAGVHSGAWSALAFAAADAAVEALFLVCPDPEAPAGAPAPGAVRRPTVWVEAEEDPGFARGEVEALLADAPHARLHVVAGAGRHFRAGLSRLAALVPPLLGRGARE